MKKLLLSFVLCSIIIAPLWAQQTVFSVILNKGDNYITSGKVDHEILLGSKLGDTDVIKIESTGYVALVHESTGASLELTEGGQYEVSELENRLLKRPTTVLAKYGMFLMKKLNPDEKGNQNLNVTGAVERGDMGVIDVDLPKVNDLFGDQIIIKWKQADDIEDYVVTIKDKLDEIITEKPVKGTSLVIDLNQGQLHNEKMIIICVHAQKNRELRSPDFGIKRLGSKEGENISNEFDHLKMVANSNNVVDKLLIASFFEENHLLADAITYYNEAQVISPDPEGFNRLYNNFLVRNGLRN